ncbi:sigma-70 family RNA polymerase sigma factor [Haliscomenobacter hydrossis]|uniref:RNA polymerase, sigma-24 subunit, ECF subfamily n=1 Tax=Haliscomenobacter hydrossis (strain ATCC 27775 / DSM 1100 / LMG 10767 / O) TaxID=760192 RepID=F4KVT4_HALH1|nr:sigma-70 family RNA polymerase sigma factor [Haliscomenobacter hydrossis]AEE53509.1 RNA polymerase, sigma-24 subunit, ECF subfamily [Haliscomenobacter hydrossis DSM 1100]
MRIAIQEIWTDLHQELTKFIMRKVKDEDASADILQEVFIKIHLNVHKLKDYNKLTSWTYQITRNTIADYFRSQKPYVAFEQLDLPEEIEPDFQGLANCINGKIEHLPKHYQEVMLLTALKDYTQVELAAYLGISYSGTKSRVQRAKDRLKALVADCKNVELDAAGNIIDYDPKV